METVEGCCLSERNATPHALDLLEWNSLDDEKKKWLIDGIELFDNGDFWHAHESWEELWKYLKTLERPNETDAIQGIIQISALLFNYEKRKIRGVVNMASKLISKLSKIEHGIWGIDVAQLRVDLIPYIRDAASDEPKWDIDTKKIKINSQNR